MTEEQAVTLSEGDRIVIHDHVTGERWAAVVHSVHDLDSDAGELTGIAIVDGDEDLNEQVESEMWRPRTPR